MTGKKYDSDKPPVYRGVMLRFPRALMEIAKVSALGAEKYEVPIENTSCLDVPDGALRYGDAQVRHLLLEAIHGRVNVETGGALPEGGRQVMHAAQNAWDALCRLEILLREEERRAIEPDQPTHHHSEVGFDPVHPGGPVRQYHTNERGERVFNENFDG